MMLEVMVVVVGMAMNGDIVGDCWEVVTVVVVLIGVV